MSKIHLDKGDRVRATWISKPKLVALAGVQMKAQITRVPIIGVVRHIRGDRPFDPTVVKVYLDPEVQSLDGELTQIKLKRPPGCTCSFAHVEVDLLAVEEIL